jgi:hypothetical protein
MSMVPLATTRSGFEAKVLAARLGSEGIVWQFRGPGADALYPVGSIEVLVEAADLDAARELLLADEVEAAFDDDDAEIDDSSDEWWPGAALAVFVGCFVLMRLFALG